MLDPATLKFQTRKALSKAKSMLMRDRSLDPFVWIIHEDLTVGMSKLPGEAMNSGRAKDAIFRLIGEYCRKAKAPGMIIVTDGWTLEQTPEQMKRLMSDADYHAAFDKISRDEGLAETAAAGFGRLVETIVCQGQTPQFAYLLTQNYERVATDGVMPASALAGLVRSGGELPEHKIRFRGEPETRSSEDGWEGAGRIFSLYEGAVREEEAKPAAGEARP